MPGIEARRPREGIPLNERAKITPEMIRIYDEYTHLTLDRRDFMQKLKALAGSTAAAMAIAPMLEASKASAAIVPEGDPRLAVQTITWPGAEGATMSGYLAVPADAAAPLPAVMVIHENRGLNPHIEDVTRRMALEGFLALAPDFLAPAGGTPEDEDKAREMIGALDRAQTVANAVATVAFLKNHDDTNGKVGAIGFCWGGGMVNQAAIHAGADLAAGVAYYGAAPDPADAGRIEARVLLHYAGLDERVNAGIEPYRQALEAAEVEHAIHIYEGANHAFNNDTSSARYDKAAADLAWSRTVEFLRAALA
jgi:carboxymethylenebutenolidase